MERKRPLLERFSARATHWAGSSLAFAFALLIILVWVASGPFFQFSDTWQLVINTSTTIVTFLMVFLIQRSQNKDSQALQLKLNELVAAVEGASNRLINVEDLSEKEVQSLHRHYEKLVELAKVEQNLTESHSIEEAEARHGLKIRAREPSRQQHRENATPELKHREGARGTNGRYNNSAPPIKSSPHQSGPCDLEVHDHQPDPAEVQSLESGSKVWQNEEACPEMEQFLAAAEALRARIQWHEQRIAEHRRLVKEIKDSLSEHGVRLRALLQMRQN